MNPERKNCKKDGQWNNSNTYGGKTTKQMMKLTLLKK